MLIGGVGVIIFFFNPLCQPFEAPQESGQFTMEEMLDKAPPEAEGQEQLSTVTLFLDVLAAFEIETFVAFSGEIIQKGRQKNGSWASDG